MYIGMWGADVSDAQEQASSEIDLYAGYNFELMSIPMYVGVTGYYYTDNFDQDYEEVNFGGDFGMFSFDAEKLEAINQLRYSKFRL